MHVGRTSQSLFAGQKKTLTYLKQATQRSSLTFHPKDGMKYVKLKPCTAEQGTVKSSSKTYACIKIRCSEDAVKDTYSGNTV